jgi:zinc protease
MKYPRLSLIALAAALAAAAGTVAYAQATPWPQAGSDLTPDPDVRFGTLPNGMRYAIRRNATPPGQASMRLRIDAGSLHEAEDQRGLAHFIEHMAFNGTTHLPENEFIHRLERHGLRFGPDTNASTDFRQTVYKLDLPQSNAETIDTAFYLLREVASEIAFAPAAIEGERSVIHAEERTRAGPQLRIVMDQLGYLMRGQRLPTRFPLGTAQVISTAQRERFTAFYNAYYRPERATLIVVGDVDPAAMETQIRARFGDWRGRGAAGRDPDLGAVAARRTEARVFVEAGGPSQVNLAWVRPADLRPDTRAVRSERLIGQLALAVLNRRLERIAATQAPSPFVVGRAIRQELAETADWVQLVAVTRPGEWRGGLGVLDTEQRRLVEHGVTAAELAREITEIRTALTAQAAGARTRPSAALSEALTGAVDQDDVFIAPAESLRLFEGAVAALTPAQVQQSARTLFAGEPVVYLTSPTAVEGGDAALLAAYRQAHAAPVAAAAAHQAQAWPYTSFGTPGTVAERRELPDGIGATAVRFANGVRLTVKRTDFTDDQVLVAVRFGNGLRGLAPGQPASVWAMSPALTSGGLGRMSFEDLQEALSARQYGAAFGAGEDAFQLTGQTRPEDFATQMQVLAAYVTDPGWRPTGFDRIRAIGGTLHDQLASTPAGVFARDARVLLHNGERRWGMPTREEMAATTLADIRAVLDPALARGPIEVIVVGDIAVDEAIAQVAATFGALPARADTPVPQALTRFPAGTAEPVRLTHGGRADQALGFIGWPTTGFYADQRQARALAALADVFQLRLLQKIREEQGTTYSPQAGHAASETFADYGLFSGQIEARPEALAGFLRDAEAIAANLRDEPIGADEIQRAIRPRIEGLQRQRRENGWWLSELAGIQSDPRVGLAITSGPSDYQALAAADLQRVARQFLLPGRAWKLVIVPREGAAAPAS